MTNRLLAVARRCQRIHILKRGGRIDGIELDTPTKPMCRFVEILGGDRVRRQEPQSARDPRARSRVRLDPAFKLARVPQIEAVEKIASVHLDRRANIARHRAAEIADVTRHHVGVESELVGSSIAVRTHFTADPMHELGEGVSRARSESASRPQVCGRLPRDTPEGPCAASRASRARAPSAAARVSPMARRRFRRTSRQGRRPARVGPESGPWSLLGWVSAWVGGRVHNSADLSRGRLDHLTYHIRTVLRRDYAGLLGAARRSRNGSIVQKTRLTGA